MRWVALSRTRLLTTPSWFFNRTYRPSVRPSRAATSTFTQTSFSSIISFRIGFDWVRPNECTGARPKSSRNMPGGGSAGFTYFGTGSKPLSRSAVE